MLAQAHSSKTSLIEQIISSQKAGALDIARFVADTFGYPLLDLAPSTKFGSRPGSR